MSSYKKTKSKSELAVIVEVAKRPYAIILYLRFSTLNLRDICSCIIFNEKSMSKELVKLLSTKKNSKLLQRKLEYIGRKILQNTYKEIHLLYKNEI